MELHDGEPFPEAEHRIELGVPTEVLWRYLVDGSLASLWMGGRMTVEPRWGGKVLLQTDSAPLIFGTVEEIVPGESITWTWRTSDGEPTQVQIRLTALPNGSAVAVIERMVPYEIVIIPPTLG